MRRVCRETTIINERVGEEKPRSKVPILSDCSHGVPIQADRLRIVIWSDRNEVIDEKYLKEDLVLVPEPYQGYVPDAYMLTIQ